MRWIRYLELIPGVVAYWGISPIFIRGIYYSERGGQKFEAVSRSLAQVPRSGMEGEVNFRFSWWHTEIQHIGIGMSPFKVASSINPRHSTLQERS